MNSPLDSPPGLVAFLIMGAVVAVFLVVATSKRSRAEWIYLATILAATPFAIGAFGFYWRIQSLGREGYTGMQDPRKILDAMNQSFFLGSITTAVLLVLGGFLIWRLKTISSNPDITEPAPGDVPSDDRKDGLFPKFFPKTHSPADLRWSLMLLLLCAVVLVLFVAYLASFGLPQYRASLRFVSWVLAPVALFGLLLWCVESVYARPALTRFALRFLAVSLLLWCLAFFVSPIYDSHRTERQMREKREVSLLLEQMAKDGEIDAPFTLDSLRIYPRRPTGYIVEYKTKDEGKKQIYVRKSEDRFWLFQEEDQENEIKKPRAE